jgi:Tfp pilus assembly protein PilZ
VAGVSKRERRSHFRGKPRPGRRVEVSFTADDGTRERAHTRNIGVGGAFVVTQRPARPGAPLRLAVHIPSATEPLQLAGEVRWTDAQGMGIRFDGLDVEAVLALNEYFASLTGKDES